MNANAITTRCGPLYYKLLAFMIVRITNEEIDNNLESVLKEISNYL